MIENTPSERRRVLGIPVTPDVAARIDRVAADLGELKTHWIRRQILAALEDAERRLRCSEHKDVPCPPQQTSKPGDAA